MLVVTSVAFEPREGVFIADAPVGFEGSLDVHVTARTDQGRAATADFKIVVSGKNDQTAHETSAPVGKSSLSEQMRAAGEDSLLAEAAEFLERLAAAAA